MKNVSSHYVSLSGYILWVKRTFAPKDLFQKDLLSKGAFGKRTFCPKDLLVLSLKSKY